MTATCCQEFSFEKCSVRNGLMKPGFSLVELVFGLTAGAAVFCMAIGTVERT